MNERATTEFDRRVYRREFAAALGYGITWFRALEKRGTIPRGRTDPGGKRLWWLASEVRATLARLNEPGNTCRPAPPPAPPQVGEIFFEPANGGAKRLAGAA